LELKRRGVTIVFVSHDLEAVKVLADRVIWMRGGSIRLDGKAETVISRYLANLIETGIQGENEPQYSLETSPHLNSSDLSGGVSQNLPPYLSVLPNVDHRFGNGKAHVEGIGIFSANGSPVRAAAQGDRVCIRISVRFNDGIERPNIGFMMRDRLGQDVTGTNLLLEGQRLPATKAGDRVSADFVLDLPFLHSGYYYFSPAIANGNLDSYEMCDWVENAYALELVERATTYGYMRIPMHATTLKVAQPE
jgi:hypothetical protein